MKFKDLQVYVTIKLSHGFWSLKVTPLNENFVPIKTMIDGLNVGEIYNPYEDLSHVEET